MCWQGARHAFAEAVGKNIANPTATLLSACGMLKHIHLEYHAKMIDEAVLKVIKGGKVSCWLRVLLVLTVCFAWAGT